LLVEAFMWRDSWGCIAGFVAGGGPVRRAALLIPYAKLLSQRSRPARDPARDYGIVAVPSLNCSSLAGSRETLRTNGVERFGAAFKSLIQMALGKRYGAALTGLVANTARQPPS